MNLKFIKEYWNNTAKKSNANCLVSPTSRDPYLAKLERNFIISGLKKNYNCLEIGCGDALNTIYYVDKVKSIIATDNSEKLLKIAKNKANINKKNNLDFQNISALDLPESFNNKFNCVISQRCIINLGNWNNQKKTIRKIHKSLKKNGVFILTEGFEDKLKNLNKLRQKFNLNKINVAKYNKFLTTDKFDNYIKKYFIIKKIHNYGSYIILSHLFHPLIVSPSNPKHESKINKISMDFQENNILDKNLLKKYSYNLGYMLIKKNY